MNDHLDTTESRKAMPASVEMALEGTLIMKPILIVVAFLAAILVAFSLAGRIADAYIARRLKKAILRELKTTSKEDLIQNLRREIQELEAKIQTVKRHAASSHAIGSASGPLGGEFNRLRHLKVKLATIEAMDGAGGRLGS
jgi:hypothetical protein